MSTDAKNMPSLAQFRLSLVHCQLVFALMQFQFFNLAFVQLRFGFGVVLVQFQFSLALCQCQSDLMSEPVTILGQSQFSLIVVSFYIYVQCHFNIILFSSWCQFSLASVYCQLNLVVPQYQFGLYCLFSCTCQFGVSSAQFPN